MKMKMGMRMETHDHWGEFEEKDEKDSSSG